MRKADEWRKWIHDETERHYASGERYAPAIVDLVRDDLPFKYLTGLARQAVQSEVQKAIRGRQSANQDEVRRRVRASDGDRKVYFTYEQLELEGIIEHVRAQLAREQAIRASTLRDVQNWLDAHPACELTVADIIEQAEAA